MTKFWMRQPNADDVAAALSTAGAVVSDRTTRELSGLQRSPFRREDAGGPAVYRHENDTHLALRVSDMDFTSWVAVTIEVLAEDAGNEHAFTTYEFDVFGDGHWGLEAVAAPREGFPTPVRSEVLLSAVFHVLMDFLDSRDKDLKNHTNRSSEDGSTASWLV